MKCTLRNEMTITNRWGKQEHTSVSILHLNCDSRGITDTVSEVWKSCIWQKRFDILGNTKQTKLRVQCLDMRLVLSLVLISFEPTLRKKVYFPLIPQNVKRFLFFYSFRHSFHFGSKFCLTLSLFRKKDENQTVSEAATKKYFIFKLMVNTHLFSLNFQLK